MGADEGFLTRDDINSNQLTDWVAMLPRCTLDDGEVTAYLAWLSTNFRAFAGFLDARRRVLFSNGVAVSVVSSDSSGRVKASALFFLIFSYTLRSLMKSEALDVNMPATLRL